MRQPENPKGPPLTEHQNTVLLTDMPVASAESQTAPFDAAHRPSSQATAVLSQRYDVLAEAGHGSMGSVYKARDRETGEIVALKLLKPEIASDQAMMDRFKNELLFARKITHKNVCRVHEFNRLGGIAYTSMEFVEGESLRSVLNRFGGLPVRKAIDLAQQICSGLQEAHAQGIVHRDLKPENVMIDAQGNVKIMDFGIARSMEAGTRLTGSMVGTPAYMAPEQVAGKSVDYRTDVYALGLILYEVFTGAPAFQAENAVAVALKQMREVPAAPHEIEPTIPVPIERAILKCIEKEPSKRFQTVGDLKNALKTPTNATPAVPAMAHHSSHEVPFASHPLYGSSALSPARPTRRASVLAWVLVGLLLCGATFAGTRWPDWKQRAQQILLPPPSPVAPKPPDFALASSEPTTAPAEPQSGTAPAADAQPDVSDTAASPTASTEPTRAESKEEKPAANAAASAEAKPVRRVAPTGTEKTEPPSDTQAASSANAPKTPHKASGQARQVLTPVLNDHMASYVWVGRYEREERAQAAAKKIEDLGLPVSVIPRRSATGAVYVVVTGPFGPDRVTSVIDWLKTQGFLGVRAINNPAAQGRQSPDARSAARIGGPEE